MTVVDFLSVYRTGIGVVFSPQKLQGNKKRDFGLIIWILPLSSRFNAAGSRSTGYRASTVSDSSRFGYRAGTVSDSSRFPGFLPDRNRSRCRAFSSCTAGK